MHTTVKPFIKWVGGKSQLLDEIRKKYPEKIDKYCEPFVGGGAVLLDVLANFKPETVLINDINPELTNTYRQIRDHIRVIVPMLGEIQEYYWRLTEEERRLYYFDKRNRFNELIQQNVSTEEKAVLFIFLNKTCFNGLYRVNSEGRFNVPPGKYKHPMICDHKHLRAVSKLLKHVDIQCGDYSKCVDFIDDRTFVYIDPPYRPLTETASFTSYAKTSFGDEQQKELGCFIKKISDKGAKIVASNSDPKNTNEEDSFFDDIYKCFRIERVSATRMINSDGRSRGPVNELLICNF